MNSPPQTNEVRRSTILIAVGQVLAARLGMPLRLSEVRASGSLHLMCNQYGLDFGGMRFGPTGADVVLSPDWEGARPPRADVVIAGRHGVDLNSLNPCDPKDALRLRAYFSADQPERIARTEAAVALFDAVVDRGDAIGWIADRLGR